MQEEYPTLRPMGQFREDTRGDEVGFTEDHSAHSTMIPWIDIHGHHHTLTWRELEKFDLTGCHDVVMAVGNIGDQSPYRPISAEDIRSHWDQAVRLSHVISRSHSFEAHVAVGVHTTNGPGEGLSDLIERISDYAVLDEVVALSETGITMVQEDETLELPEQRQRVRKQLRIAKETGLPAVLHTPTIIKGDPEYASISLEAHDTGDVVLDRDNPKLQGTMIDVEIADEVGLSDDRIVFTHAHRTMAPWVLENTDCYVSFTVGNATRDVSTEDIKDAIDEYGPDRVMVDTDCARLKEFETFDVRRTVLDLIRMGADPDDVRTVVYENQLEVLGLDHPSPS